MGVLDDRALLRAWRPGGLGRSQRRVGELLSPTHVTVSPATTIPAVATLLCERAIDAVPVVDEDEHLIGVVTAWDLVRVPAGHTR